MTVASPAAEASPASGTAHRPAKLAASTSAALAGNTSWGQESCLNGRMCTSQTASAYSAVGTVTATAAARAGTCASPVTCWVATSRPAPMAAAEPKIR